MSRTSFSSHTITTTILNHKLIVGDPVVVDGSTDAVFNTTPYSLIRGGGDFGVVSRVVDDNTFEFLQAPTTVDFNVSSALTATGTVTLYERDTTYSGVTLSKNGSIVTASQTGVTTDNIILIENTNNTNQFEPWGLNTTWWIQEFGISAQNTYNSGYSRPITSGFTYETVNNTSLIITIGDITTYSIKQIPNKLTLNYDYPKNKGFFFYMGTRAENKFWNVFSGESNHTTSTGLPLQPNIYVDEGLNGGQDWFSRGDVSTLGGFNPFRNCSCVCPLSGETSSVISGTSYDGYCNQLGENALGFRITDDNKLGWRKVSVTGECRNNKFTITGNTIEEEYTTTSVIPEGNSPTLIQVVYLQGGEKNGLPSGTLKMFVNGRLVLKSKEFIGMQLRALNEWSDKQQGVPYNMSWGGGTQGLVESQTFEGPDLDDRGLTLEENFAGSFLGQLSQLRFYKRPLNVLELRNNLFSECGRYCVRSTFGGSQVIQPGSSLCGDCSTGNLPPYC
jgi:hypothetical protein